MQYTKHLLLLILTFVISINTNAQLDTTGLIAHWPFDGNLNDITGKGHNGQLVYAGQSGTPIPTYVAGVTGQQGKAHQHRTNIITYANTQPDLNIVKYSVAAVVKFDTLDYASILSRQSLYGIAYQHNYGLGAVASPTYGNFFLPLKKPAYPYPTPQFNYTNGNTDSTWYFVVVTFDSLIYKTYINGQLRNIAYAPYRVTDTGTGLRLSIGGVFDTQFLQYSGMFSGALDDLRLYNRVLSDSEIVRYPFGFFDTAVVISKMDTVLCSGDSTLSIESLVSKPFRNNNTFTVQLSDATGSFASPTTIGSVNSNTSGSIPCTIPTTTTAGQYLVRIIATAPADTSYEYSLNIHPTQNTHVGLWIVSFDPYRNNPTGYMSICASDSLSFIADSLSGITTTSSYQWQKNGQNIIGETNNHYNTGSISSNDSFRVIVTTDHECWAGVKDTSRSIKFNVVPIPKPTVTIAPLLSDTICLNKKGSFIISSAADTGNTTNFRWYLNSNPVYIGDTLSRTLNNNDTVYCIMYTNTGCLPSLFDTISNKIIVTIDTNTVKPSVSISATAGGSVPTGTDITFTATATDAGSNPYYQWYKGQQPIPSANNNTYTAIWPSLQSGDSIRVVLKNTTAKCLDKDSTFSNLIKVRYTTSANNIAKDEGMIQLFPNPNTGIFTLKAQLPSNDAVNITVNNAIGQVVYKETITPNNSNINTTVKLPDYIPDGVYIIKATNGKLNYNQSLTISR